MFSLHTLLFRALGRSAPSCSTMLFRYLHWRSLEKRHRALLQRSDRGRRSPLRCRSAPANGGGLGFADHAVDDLDGKGDLSLLSSVSAGAELGSDQVFVLSDHSLVQVTPTVTGRTLPAHAASLHHVRRTSRSDELDVVVARCLLGQVGRARHRQDARSDDQIRRSIGMPGGGSLVDGWSRRRFRAPGAWNGCIGSPSYALSAITLALTPSG